VLRPAVEIHRALAGTDLAAELRRDHDLPFERLERLADELLVRERAVDFGRVEERDAALDGSANQLDAFFAIRSRPVAEAQAHATEPEGGHFELAELALLHLRFLVAIDGGPVHDTTL
jgi:hypothetical protein